MATRHKSLLFRASVYGSAMSAVKRRWAYLGIMFSGLSVIWLPVVLFITLSPLRYTSEWTLILPGSGAGSAVNLESIGQASTASSSPYTSPSIDPKVNYKAIAESQPVLQSAAAALGMSAEEFGKPKIKLVDQTALMYFSVTGPSAEIAQLKSQALHQALQEQLSILRGDEIASREASISGALDAFRGKLNNAQLKVSNYQTQSDIVTLEQFEQLALGIEEMHQRHAEIVAQARGLTGRVEQLATTLGVTPELASAALTLQTDATFRQLLLDYAEPNARLVEYNTKWGPKHPRVIKERKRLAAAKRALLQRSQALIGQQDERAVALLTLSDNDHRSELFASLIKLHAERLGAQQEADELSRNIQKMQQRLELSTNDAAVLQDLKNQQQVATAVFTSALAKLDIGKSDLFASYPLVQMLAQPTLADSPDTLKQKFALLGGAAGSLFLLFGLFLLWLRKPLLQKIFQNA